MAKNRFLGCQYPLVKTPRGIMAQKNGINQIKADLLQLILTNPGERVMLPTYGTPLRKLMFDPNDSQLATGVKLAIVNAIATWEPRIELSNIEVRVAKQDELSPDDSGYERDSVLYIKISFYDPEKINEIQDLSLQVPLAGA